MWAPEPEDAVPVRPCPDAGCLVLAQSDRDELGKHRARGVQDAKRGVFGIDELGGMVAAIEL